MRTVPALLILAACGATDAGGTIPAYAEMRREGGRCIAQAARPAVIVTETVESADGTTTTTQSIERERTARSFEAVCPETLDETMVATLQRALAARGVYEGRIGGEYDAATTQAVRGYQAATGRPDSGALAVETARFLGLIPTPVPEG
ncbi:MAG: peptidoglycan-binding domain-containing protein [Paracoccaceae bacterium]